MKADDAQKLLLVMRERQSRYAIPAECVEEILEVPAITPLPLQPAYMRGMFNYKGHAIPALSLQVLAGDGAGDNEGVCVVSNAGGALVGITADAAETLMADDGRRLKYDEELLDGKLLKVSYVMPGEPAIFAIDLEKICQAIEDDFDQEASSAR